MRQGAEKLREMEQILAGAGQFNEQFDLTLGDVMIDDGEPEADPADPEGPAPPPKLPKNPFPSIDGDESVEDFVSRYKKALLNRRSQFRGCHEQWMANPPKTGQCLVLYFFFDH